ncbi:tetratricopeptide repeat protein [Polynucleobacter paneuropaeus]|uniref:tetratricopeptide repeat-containing glycosyltransferase family protein n=1 Tax=Polynucleobacter paneuropaeus TaxID=2527775 RepID=UPI001BFD403C|nr:tetratricopeptide repeat-containing glycosyltransferase family protein [Polynucleobacter paneuropaeus]MBT8623102.1 tetratricopeptide repeat protein [Polynucleobacter paneuropaeus]
MSLADQLQEAIKMHQGGDLDGAKKIYQEYLAQDEDNIYVLHLLGNIFLQENAPREALDLFNRSIAINPNYSNVYHDRGIALHNLGLLSLASDNFKQLIILEPKNALAYQNHGRILQKLEKIPDALESFSQAIALKPDLVVAYFDLGVLFNKMNQVPLAIENYDHAILLKPDYVDAYYNRGIAYHTIEELSKAISNYDQAIKLNPDFIDAYYNRGIAYQSLEEYALAIMDYTKVVNLDPHYEAAYVNRGIAYYLQQFPDQAIVNYDQALKITGHNPEALFNKGLALLMKGDLLGGFELYEWRFRGGVKELQDIRFTNPIWDGTQSLANKSILLHGEQGLGDIIQFCRYVPLVARHGAKVILQVPEALKWLLSNLEGCSQVLTEGEQRPDVDYECALMSLPHLFKTTIETIPSPGAYIIADPQKIEHWERILGPKLKPRIGIVWSSVSAFTKDLARSIPLSQFITIVLPDKYEYICLQKIVKEDDIGILKSNPAIRFFGDDLSDMSDTAALIQTLDLVITVDTSVAHLAAALGKATWILNRLDSCWRWQLDRKDSPWYSCVKLYRQVNTGDWQTVLENVRTDLAEN